jgi:hypothetical protein
MRITTIENAIGNRITIWKRGVPIPGFFRWGFRRTPMNPPCPKILKPSLQEAPMHYKTIALEMIQENSSLYERLRSSKMLLTSIEAYAIDLKHAHDQWKERLAWDRPSSDSRQIAAEALELAMQEIQDRLPSALPAREAEPLSLDAAMNYVRQHTPSA